MDQISKNKNCGTTFALEEFWWCFWWWNIEELQQQEQQLNCNLQQLLKENFFQVLKVRMKLAQIMFTVLLCFCFVLLFICW